MRKHLCALTLILVCSCELRAGNAESVIAALSGFEKINPSELARGEILTRANTSMDFARGISAHACYAIVQTPEAMSRLLLQDDPTRHPELEVFQYHTFRDAISAKFDMVKLDPKSDTMKRLLDAMAKPAELQLSMEEARIVSASQSEPRKFWSGVLAQRWMSFEKGGPAALPPYLIDGKEVRVLDEMRSLLKEESKIAARFAELLSAAAINGAHSAPPEVYYWSNSKVDKMAAFDTGAIYARNAGDHWQLLDVNFYVSSGYFTSLTFYELWPSSVGTLVWQCDLVSAPGLVGGFGLKRKIASMMIQNDVKQSVRALQQDAIASSRAKSRDPGEQP